MSPRICSKFEGRLIASCQAVDGDPFRDSRMIATFAKAAVLGGAAAIRAANAEDIRAVRQAVSVPILGIRKAKHTDGMVLITPTFEAARELVEAGADMVALDCTARGQSFGALDRLRRIRAELGVPVAADIATLDEAQAADAAGADFVLSTMRGYTAETRGINAFQPEFIEALVRCIAAPVIAEGQIHAPEQARQAIAAGAFAVVVGTAISRPRNIASWFAQAIEKEYAAIHNESCYIGIDLGGTTTKFGLVKARTGELLFNDRAATPAAGGRDALLIHLKRIASMAMERSEREGHKPVGIGVATAGWVDISRGVVAYATENLPGWTGTRVADELKRELRLPVAVENDANALALAERYFGAGRELKHFVCITLGTGVGGGCFIDGRLNRGAHYFANATGHMTLYPNGLPCSCGKRGCLEAYANAAALLRYAGHRFSDARELIEAAHAGDSGARAAIGELANHLAQGLASIVQLLDPEAIIVSGGLAQNNALLLEDLRIRLAEYVSTWKERGADILPSALGYHGGVLGAAAIARELIR